MSQDAGRLDTIARTLTALLKQQAADAYLVQLDGTLVGDVDRALRAGNNNLSPIVLVNGVPRANEVYEAIPNASPDLPVLPGATRFTDAMSRMFLRSEVASSIVAQLPNDASGLSITVLRSNADPGAYTVAFRSSEFPDQIRGGDNERDILGADPEVALHGFAWGQLAAADRWFAAARAPGGALDGATSITLTGYSLGGHIAQVMTELHADSVDSAWIFNGAGRGTPAAGYTIRQLLDAYSALLANPDADIPWLLGPPSRDVVATTLHAAAVQETGDPLTNGRATLYDSARHAWAKTVLGPYATGALAATVFDIGAMDPEADAKTVYVYGMATHHDDTLTALSGVVPSQRLRVFIEDQPLAFGPYPAIPGLDSAADKLNRDFLRTHSITLIADSLALSRAFQRVDLSLTQERIDAIFAAASNQVSRSRRDIADASAEADSLENALDALRWVLIPTSASGASRLTKWDDSPLGFGNLDNRNLFFDRITELETFLDAHPGPRYSITPLATLAWKGETGLGGFVTRRTVAWAIGQPMSPQVLLARAKEDSFVGEGYRVALENLAPFALTADRSIYDTGKVALDRFSDQYLKDRALLLSKRLEINLDNKTMPDRAGVIPVHLEDRGAGLRIDWMRKEPDRRGTDNPIFVKFGLDDNAETETIEGGGNDDRLYGRGGNDSLYGGALNDHLEGNDGDDRLRGGSGRDTLSGGRGDDELHGEAGADTLDGGEGVDRLAGGDDNDTLIGGMDDDRLLGGPGFDTYVVGAGYDVIVDEAGGGTIRAADGVTLSGAFEKRDGRYVFESNASITARLDGSVLTVDLGALAGFRIEAYRNGDLGITLVEVPGKGAMSRGYVGDFLPLPATDSGSPRDEWGNLEASPIPDEGRRDEFVGSPSDDSIFTYFGRDRVSDTWGGHDVIALGFDDDAGSGGSGNDTITGDAGWDALFGEEGNDRLFGAGERSVADAVAAAGRSEPAFPEVDWIDGADGDDIIDGADGDDLLFGGPGNDRIVGGSGGDLVLADQTMAPLHATLGWDVADQHPGWSWRVDPSDPFTVAVTASDRGPHSDAATIFGSAAGNDIVYAGAGDDFVETGGGDDIAYGGSGRDTLIGNDGDDALAGEDDDDRITGDSGSAIVAGHTVVPGNDVLTGGAGNDWLQGEGGDDHLDGGAGNDQLLGDGEHVSLDLQGSDTLIGGAGDDRLVALGGRDFVEGGSGRDFLDGGRDDDVLLGGDGDDELLGGDGDDLLDGGPGADWLRGGAGNDLYVVDQHDRVDDDEGENVIRFASGVNPRDLNVAFQTKGGVVYATASAGGNLIVEWKAQTLAKPAAGGLQTGPGESASVVFEFDDDTRVSAAELLGRSWSEAVTRNGSGGADELVGQAGDDRLFGSSGDDILHGYDGDDRIDGGFGADVIVGGRGDDYTIGGGGGDTYVFSEGDGHDEIVPDHGDRLVFGSGLAPEDVQLVRRVNGDLLIELPDTGDSLLVRAAYTSSLSKLVLLTFVDGGEIAGSDLSALPLAPVQGTEGDDLLLGSDESETLLGLAGDDTLDGRAGNDILAGGAGADTYVLSMHMGFDEVRETSGSGGTIRLEAGLTWETVVPEAAGGDLVLRLAGTAGAGRQGLRIVDGAATIDSWRIVEEGGEPGSLRHAVDSFNAAVAADPTFLIKRDFRQAFVHALDALARVEGLERSGPMEYASPAYVAEYTDTRVVTVVDRFDSDGAVVASEQREKTPWHDLRPSRLHRNVRSLTFTESPATGEGEWTVGEGAVPVPSTREAAGLASTIGPERRVDTSNGQLRIIGDAATAAPGEAVREQSYDVRFDRDVRYVEIAGDDVPVDVVHKRITVPVVQGDAAANRILYRSRALVDAGPGDDVVSASPDALPGYDDLPSSQGVLVDGGPGNDSIRGMALDDTLIGGTGDDTLRGAAGQDRLIGGDGADVMEGGIGADRYEIGAADRGIDVIADISSELLVPETTAQMLLEQWYASEYPGDTLPRRVYARDDPVLEASGLVDQDVVVLPAGVRRTDLVVRLGSAGRDDLGLSEQDVATLYAGGIQGGSARRTWDVLDLSWGDDRGARIFAGDWARPIGQEDPAVGIFNLDFALIGGSGSGIEQIEFADGSRVGVSELRREAIQALTAVDFARGSGAQARDAIGTGSAVRFAADIQPWDLDIAAVAGSLVLSVRGTGDSLTLQNWFGPVAPDVERFLFADGGEYTAADLAAAALQWAGTPGDDVILGAARHGAAVDAGEGDDVVVSYAGGDFVDGNRGDDWIDGGSGDDDLVDRAGSNVVLAGSGNDRVLLEGQRGVVLGGDGDDTMRLRSDAVLVDGGAGRDSVSGAAQVLMVRVGVDAGEDRLDVDAGTLVLLADRRLRMPALAVGIDGRDLLVHVGASTTMRIVDGWARERIGALQLQTVTDRIRVHDLRSVLDDLRWAVAQSPGLTRLAVPQARWGAPVFESATMAFGGDWAIGEGPAQPTPDGIDPWLDTVATPSFGDEAQMLTLRWRNGAPVPNGRVSDLDVAEGTRRSVSLPTNLFIDPDPGDDITLTASFGDGGALPAWVRFDADHGVLVFEPGADDVGRHEVAITATDDAGDSATTAFVVTVQAMAGPVHWVGSAGDDDVRARPGTYDVSAGDGDDSILGPASSAILRGEDGDDWVRGQGKEDTLFGGAGSDILLGGDGHDALRGDGGRNLLAGEAGNDWLFGQDERDLLVGGTGDDDLRIVDGHYVVAFNRGDGRDRITTYGAADSVLSFGGGVRPSDIVLQRSGEDLEVDLGSDDSVTLVAWYSSFARRSVSRLQFIEASGNESGPTVTGLDFRAVVDAYDAQRTADPGITRREVGAAAEEFDADPAQGTAFGGDLAVAYATGDLYGVSVPKALEILRSDDFAVSTQALFGQEWLRTPSSRTL